MEYDAGALSADHMSWRGNVEAEESHVLKQGLLSLQYCEKKCNAIISP